MVHADNSSGSEWAEEWEDIEGFGQCKHEWLKQYLQLPMGIHDSISRLFRQLKPNEFQSALLEWVEVMHASFGFQLVASTEARRVGRKIVGRCNPRCTWCVHGARRITWSLVKKRRK